MRALFIVLVASIALCGMTEPGQADPFPYRNAKGPIPPGYEVGLRSQAVIKMTSGVHKGDQVNVTYDGVNSPDMPMAHRFTFTNGVTLTVNLATKQAFVFYPHAKRVHSFPYNELPRHPNGEPDLSKILAAVLGGDITLLRDAEPPLWVFPRKELEFPGPKGTPWPMQPEGTADNLIVLVHGCCTDAMGLGLWYTIADQIAGEIEKRQDADKWEILVLDWHKYTPVPTSLQDLLPAFIKPYEIASAKNGPGRALGATIASHSYRYVHLIGHSTGSELIDAAAKAIQESKKSPPPFLQLTFLDAYTPNSSDIHSLGDLAVPHYAEHYVDLTPGPLIALYTNTILKNAVNFDITDWKPAIPEGKGWWGHMWPIYWYQKSVESATFRYGYNQSLEAGKFVEALTKGYPPGTQCSLTSAGKPCVPK